MFYGKLSENLHGQYVELRKLALPDAQSLANDVLDWEFEAKRLEDAEEDSEAIEDARDEALLSLAEVKEELTASEKTAVDLQAELDEANERILALEGQVEDLQRAASHP